MPRAEPEEPRRPRWWRRLLLALLAFVLLFYAGGGWYFSGVIDERALDGAARRASTDFDPHLTIEAIEPAVDVEGNPVPGAGTITVRVLDDDPRSVRTEGTWGLRWEGGYGQVGGIVGRRGDTITRSFVLVDGELPEPGADAELDVRAWPDLAATGRPVEDVIVDGPLGDYPAWFVPGTSDTWAVVVHGNSMVRTDGIRMVDVLAEVGLPTLAITYRNSVGAPEDGSGRLAYGLTEWEDLEAAVRSALDRGAREVVLAGYSMGGGVIMAFLQRSGLADRVAAVVLDAPMLDFSATVDDNASRETLPLVGLPLPRSLTWVAKWLAERRFGVRWSELNYLADVQPYRSIPFLVLHGTEDTTVPIATSERFERILPERVELVRCEGAEHIECWNVDPDAYRSRVQGFVREVVPAAV